MFCCRSSVSSYLVDLGWPAESESRERAFHSGIVDFALSKGSLPGELVMWIFNAGMLHFCRSKDDGLLPSVLVPSENRDELRHAYCRAFKVSPHFKIRPGSNLLTNSLECHCRAGKITHTSQ